eukprot:1157908-Pelagomonas_calceolata.AAC.17
MSVHLSAPGNGSTCVIYGCKAAAAACSSSSWLQAFGAMGLGTWSMAKATIQFRPAVRPCKCCAHCRAEGILISYELYGTDAKSTHLDALYSRTLHAAARPAAQRPPPAVAAAAAALENCRQEEQLLRHACLPFHLCLACWVQLSAPSVAAAAAAAAAQCWAPAVARCPLAAPTASQPAAHEDDAKRRRLQCLQK